MATQYPARPQVQIQDLARYALYTDAPSSPGNRSSLIWGIRDGAPRISVFTRVVSETTKSPISAPMLPEVFLAFLARLKVIALGPKGEKEKLACDTGKYENNKATGERVLLSEVLYGKDEKGVVWIIVAAVNRPKIRFDMKLSDFHRFYHGDGSQFTEEEGSVMTALAMIEGLQGAYKNLCGGLRNGPLDATEGSGGGASAPAAPKVNDIAFDDISF